MPPLLDVFSPAVLVREVVGVLPDVEADNRRVVLEVGRELVGGGGDEERAGFVFGQPGPAAAELADRGGGKFCFKLINRTKRLGDPADQGLVNRFFWPHNVPEQGVVQITAAVVTERLRSE